MSPSRFLLTTALCISVLSARAKLATAPTPHTLDDFETLAGWTAFPSEGAQGSLAHVAGETGRALAIDFDLSATHGHVIARKELNLDLPANYQFTFDLCADSPVNNFEVKLIDADDNVWWLKRLDVTFPREWTTQHLRKRHLTFAWGPSKKPAITHVKFIEFVVSAGSGGTGRVCIDNLRFTPIDDALARTAQATITTSAAPSTSAPAPTSADQGTLIQNWSVAHDASAPSTPAWLQIDFGYERELGGLVLDWQPGRHASAYEIQLSPDGHKWTTASTVHHSNGGRDYLFLPEQQGRFLKLLVPASASANPSTPATALAQLAVKGPDFGASENAFFKAVAADHPRGTYPKYLVPEQTYWTVVGSPADVSEALLNEHGTIEVDQMHYTIEPFLYVDGKLITWADVTPRQSLEAGYLPIPSVEWRRGDLTLTVTALAVGAAGPDSQLLATYRVTSASGRPVKGRLFLALRPFQVNPPWQSLFHPAGWTRIDRIALDAGVVHVNDRPLIPLDAPSAFGATPFEAGDITEYLHAGQLPPATSANDALGFASAALAYDFDLAAGASQEFRLVSPFHPGGTPPRPNLPRADADAFARDAHDATRRLWVSMLDRFQVRLPADAQPVIDTLKSNLAYIFINQDGPRIQPGSRNYERSWIRDGSLTSTALLELGLKDEVRAYADWYAGFQFPNGKVPCVVDSRGGDPTDEHDSHGQLIYLFMQVYHYTHDAAWLRTKWPTVVKTVDFIQSLRALRKTELYRTGTAEQRSFYGLVPESISHEGYSAKPMHSYWDNFFVLRGLKDAVAIAEILGETETAARFAAERDDCAKDLYASIALAMKNHKIDYLPGCAELGDFDATSTTIAVLPVNEIGRLPEPALHNTFDRYWARFLKRRDGPQDWYDLTPYENRVIGSFVLLGQKDRSTAVMDYFMSLRRPAAWNHWAEVVFPDARTPKMVGDMPHTWCGSDFIRSVRTMFAYEREQDNALIVAAGVADRWVTDPAGIEVVDLPTYHGNLNYTLKSRVTADGRTEVTATFGPGLTVPKGGLILKSPLSRPVFQVSGDGHLLSSANDEILVTKLPATVSVTY